MNYIFTPNFLSLMKLMAVDVSRGSRVQKPLTNKQMLAPFRISSRVVVDGFFAKIVSLSAGHPLLLGLHVTVEGVTFE